MNRKGNSFEAVLLPGIRLNDDGSAPEEMLLRVERARQVHLACGQAPIVACGADAAGVGISEAEMMKRLLRQRGVEEEKILVEDGSFITAENFKNAAAFVSSDGLCALVTSDYHLMRAKLLARRAGLRVKGFKARTPFGAYKLKRRLLEFLGILDALCGWQDEGSIRPKPVERFKRFLGRRLLGNKE